MSLRPYSWRQAILKSSLPPTTRLVLLALSCHINDAGQAAHVSTATLSAETGLSERAVVTHLKSVDGDWLVTRRHGFGGQKWRRNEYLPRLPGDPSLDVEGTELPSVPSEPKGAERGSVPFAEILSEGAERPSVPFEQKGTEPDDKKALNVATAHNGFDFSITPHSPPNQGNGLFEITSSEVESWFAEVFWKRYPELKGRKKALDWLKRLRPDRGLLDAIAAGLEYRLRVEARLRAANVRFIERWPHPHRWLQQERWTERPQLPPELRGSEERDKRCAHREASGERCTAHGVRSQDGVRWWCRDHDPHAVRGPTSPTSTPLRSPP